MLLLSRHVSVTARIIRPAARHFFNLPGFKQGSDTSSQAVVQFKESKILPYTPKQMFDVVQDVRSYPEYVPYCIDAVVSSSRELANHDRLMLATLTVGISVFKVSYESKVTCRPFESVKAVASETAAGPFSYLETLWRFRPTQGGERDTIRPATRVSIDLSYALKDPVQSKVLGSMFSTLSKSMIDAFEERCKEKYGIHG